MGLTLLDRRIRVALGFLVAVLLLCAGVSIFSLGRLLRGVQGLDQSHRIVDALERLWAGVQETRTSQRDFLLLNDPAILERYRAASAAVGGQLGQLEGLAAGAPDRETRAAAIRAMVEGKVQDYDRGIQLRQEQGLEVALDFVAGAGPRQRSLELRAAIEEFQADERGLLAARRAHAAHSYNLALGTGLVAWSLGLLAVGLFAGQLGQHLRVRQEAGAAVAEQRDLVAATLTSVGDGVISTDPEGRVTFLNPVAEALTGWSLGEAMGQPLQLVFQIVNEDARGEVENPALRALREGRIVGLANHTILIARDGTERPIDDSAAPVRRADGRLSGAVLVFRDVTQRRRQERELQRSEALFRTMANTVPSFIYMASPQGAATYLNERWTEYTGVPVEEAMGQGFVKILHPDDRERVRERWLEAVRTGTTWESHHRYRGKDGVYRWFFSRAVPVRDADGNIVQWFGAVTNIDDLKQAEAESVERSRLVSLRADVASALATDGEEHAVLQRCAEALVGHLGVALARIWTLHPLEPVLELRASAGLYTTLDGAYAQVPVGESRIGRIAAQGKAHLTNELASEPDDPAWPTCEGMVAFAGYPLAVEGRVAGVLAMVADTPIPVAFLQELAPLADGIAQYIERKRAQAALVESDKQFRNLADSIPQLAFKAQPDGFVHWFNQRWYEYTGSALESMEGAGWLALVDPDDRDRVARSWTDCIRSGDPFDEVFGLRAADGGYRRFLTRVVPVRDHRGHIFRWFGTLTDVTEQQEVEAALRASEEALKEADRRKDEFLATLAHELRNPLAPIWNSLEILKATQGDPALLAQAIATMERQVGQMVRLIDDLLDISRITRNKLELRKERVALADMVRAAVETSRPLIAAGHHTLRVSVPDEPVHLDADPTRLAQVLANLLNNSAKYTEPGGTITLAAECRDREVVIAVRDTGVGIPPEMLPRIFEMFTQVEQSLDRAQGGLGIGLTLVQRLLAMHGGRVEAHSDGPGTGSTFTVYLPVLEECPPTADGAVDGAVHDGQQRRTGPSRRILVVDDNRDLAMSLAILLRIAGHEVRVAHDGPAAVAAAAEFEPAVILLDIGLPKMNGYETARAIRQEPWGSRVRLVAVTGWGQEEDRRKSAEAGFDHHLVKPVEPALLQSLLDSLDELAPVPAE